MVIIVGGGVSGLAAGIRLLRGGEPVTVIEMCPKAGGNLCGWVRDGYTIDNCIHWLSGTTDGELRKIWEETGILSGETGIHRPEYLYRSYGAGGHISFYRDPERTREEARAALGRAAAPFIKFTDACERCAEEGGTGFASRVRRMLSVARYAPRDLSSLAASMKNPLAASAVTDLLTGEYSSLGLYMLYSAFIRGNADIPLGGSVAAAERIKNKFLSLGGTLRLGETVETVIISNSSARGVRLSSGEEIRGDGVILALDPRVAFGRLLPGTLMPEKLAGMYTRPTAYPIFSAVQIAFSHPVDSLPLRGICGVPVRPLAFGGRVLRRLTVREFSYEKDFAPPGQTVLQCMLFTRAGESRAWIDLRRDDPGLYRLKKRDISSAVADRLSEHFGTDALGVIDVWTPATYNRYFGSHLGAFMSFALTGHAIPRKIEPAVPGVRRLFLAGQWTTPPGGLPSAVCSGYAAADAALKLI